MLFLGSYSNMLVSNVELNVLLTIWGWEGAVQNESRKHIDSTYGFKPSSLFCNQIRRARFVIVLFLRS